MPTISEAGEKLSRILKGTAADFIEAHLEENRASYMTYRGRELEAVGRTTSSGGNIRALSRGGWGFASFNSLDDLPGKVALAVAQAKLAGNETSHLTPMAPTVKPDWASLNDSPVDIPLAEKKALLDEYNELIWSTPKLKTSVIGYGDSQKRTLYLNSEGSRIAQQRADVTLRLTAIAAQDSDVQQVGLSLGSRGEFAVMKNRHREIAAMAQRAVDLLAVHRGPGPRFGRCLCA
jgi:TldD protein